MRKQSKEDEIDASAASMRKDGKRLVIKMDQQPAQKVHRRCGFTSIPEHEISDKGRDSAVCAGGADERSDVRAAG
jgi:hypothetical protein